MEPPQYAEYPRDKKGSIDFAILGEAFQILFRHPLPFMTASFIGYFAPYMVSTGVTIWMEFQMGMLSFELAKQSSVSMEQVGQLYAVQLLMTTANFAIMAPFAYAITKMTLKSVRGEPVLLSDVWCGFPTFFRSFGLLFLLLVLCVLGLCACVIGSPLVMGLMMLAMPVMAEENLGPFDAMRRSFDVLRPHMWIAMLLAIISYIAANAGIFACAIGLVVSFPVFFMTQALLYRDLVTGPMNQTPRTS